METNAPDEKPYSAQKRIIGTLAAEGSQRARTRMAEKAVTIIMTLKRPRRSAMMPGRMRPKILIVC